jgi:hypothetical protein
MIMVVCLAPRREVISMTLDNFVQVIRLICDVVIAAVAVLTYLNTRKK